MLKPDQSVTRVAEHSIRFVCSAGLSPGNEVAVKPGCHDAKRTLRADLHHLHLVVFISNSQTRSDARDGHPCEFIHIMWSVVP